MRNGSWTNDITFNRYDQKCKTVSQQKNKHHCCVFLVGNCIDITHTYINAICIQLVQKWYTTEINIEQVKTVWRYGLPSDIQGSKAIRWFGLFETNINLPFESVRTKFFINEKQTNTSGRTNLNWKRKLVHTNSQQQPNANAQNFLSVYKYK